MPAKKLIPEKKPRKPRRRTGAATLVSTEHKGNPQQGHVERLASYVKRTLELKMVGHTYQDIADIIFTEFKLEKVPHITTIAKWRGEGMEAMQADIGQLQMQMRIDQFNELETMKSKWLPIATADVLAVKKWKMIEGELQPEMDENALKEQIEATKQVIAIMNRQAKLLGLDIEKAASNEGDGPDTIQALQMWMIGQVNIIGGHSGQGGSIDIASEVLELKSGVPEIDDGSNSV